MKTKWKRINKYIVIFIWPEDKWSNHNQVENDCEQQHWRTEPTSVAIDGDELWLGVKGQSNLL